jgi:uncharacterized protein (DUF1810 family)
MDDPYNLNRFLHAQESSYARALAEIKGGRKQSHWMWYIFPQIDGLGVSPTARQFAIKGIEEARAYLAHPVLGPRLLECAAAVVALETEPIEEIFGYPDYLKLRSSATLFGAALPPGSVFDRLIEKYYDGKPDEKTLQLARRTT